MRALGLAAALLAWTAGPAAAIEGNKDFRPFLLRASSDSFEVVDGDTLKWAGIRLRIEALDAPERGEPGGDVAAGALFLIVGLATAVECGGSRLDRFGRPLVECNDNAGTDLAALMIGSGHARPWSSAAARYHKQLGEAQRTHAGFWACDAETPKGWEEDKAAICGK